MPNKPSALKALRKSKKQTQHNALIKKHIKALFKKSLGLVQVGNKEESLTSYRNFQQAVDKAVKVGVIHRNAANRKKSSLAKSLR